MRACTGAAVMIICDRRLCVWDQSAECRAMSESLSAFCGCCWEVKGRGVRADPFCNWGIPRVSACFPLFVSSRWLLFEKIACAVIQYEISCIASMLHSNALLQKNKTISHSQDMFRIANNNTPYLIIAGGIYNKTHQDPNKSTNWL